MSVADDLMVRVRGVLDSMDVVVAPVGGVAGGERGIQGVTDFPHLQRALKSVFAAAVVSAALLSPGDSQAAGVGYDAGVYGHPQGQVMQAGQAVRMTVLNLRPVAIELASTQKDKSGLGTGVVVAGGGLGAVLGQALGGNNRDGQRVGAILGGIMGAIGGDKVADWMNAPKPAPQLNGVEITMLNPKTDQIVVVTQAGNQQFMEGDPVLVMQVGGNTRVVLDRSRAIQQAAGFRADQQVMTPTADVVPRVKPESSARGSLDVLGFAESGQGIGVGSRVSDAVKYAASFGLEVDPRKVGELLEKGPPQSGLFIGKVVGIDPETGLVFQSIGQGKGVVHDLNALTRIPQVGESMTIRYADGQGLVQARPGVQTREMGVSR